MSPNPILNLIHLILPLSLNLPNYLPTSVPFLLYLPTLSINLLTYVLIDIIYHIPMYENNRNLIGAYYYLRYELLVHDPPNPPNPELDPCAHLNG